MFSSVFVSCDSEYVYKDDASQIFEPKRIRCALRSSSALRIFCTLHAGVSFTTSWRTRFTCFSGVGPTKSRRRDWLVPPALDLRCKPPRAFLLSRRLLGSPPPPCAIVAVAVPDPPAPVPTVIGALPVRWRDISPPSVSLSRILASAAEVSRVFLVTRNVTARRRLLAFRNDV